MKPIAPVSVFLLMALLVAAPRVGAQPVPDLSVGFGEVDVTPDLAKKPVWLAGFGKNRKATRVHDPLRARAVVFAHDKKKIAIVSADVVGLFNEVAQRVRRQLPGFTYVLVCSTHNHEGPDTMGLWGPNLLTSGIDAVYMAQLDAGLVKAIQQADTSKGPVRAEIGSAMAPELLHDGREPYVKHDELVALRFVDANKKTAGIVVQWNCHPETLSSNNTEISADFIGYTVNYLKKKHACPVVYLTGTVGGLMTSLHVEIKDDQGKPLADGTFEKTERYGVLVGKLADKALGDAKPVKLTPLEVRSQAFFMPIDNPFYVLGFNLGVLKRDAFLWKGDSLKADPIPSSPLRGRGAGGDGAGGSGAGGEGAVPPSSGRRGAGGEGAVPPSPGGRGVGGEGAVPPSPGGRGAGGEGYLPRLSQAPPSPPGGEGREERACASNPRSAGSSSAIWKSPRFPAKSIRSWC